MPRGRITFTPKADIGVGGQAKKLPFERLVGMLGRSPQAPISIEQMDEGISIHLRRKYPKK